MSKLRGIVSLMREAEKTADIKSSGKIYTFNYEVVENGETEALFEGLEVAFETNKDNEVLSVIPNRNQERPDYLKYLEVAKDVRSCVFDYFSAFDELLQKYRNIDANAPQVDFLRMRRFLLTAYNDIRDIDGNIIDKSLNTLRSEIDKIFRYFSEFKIKSNYSVKYAYEKIFLTQQPNYNALVEKITHAQSMITRATLQEKPLALQIKSKEKKLASFTDTKSKAYFVFEKNLKSMRKRYADLVYYIGKQRELLAKLLRVRVIFIERFFTNFKSIYTPLVKEFEEHLILVLNIKAAELDANLWASAKQSRLVRNFFIKSGIVGTYSSKTFLKYYLRNIDRQKAGANSQKLFALLEYLESISAKNIVLIRRTFDVATSNKELLEKFDHQLQIRIIRDVEDIFKTPKKLKDKPIKIDLIMVEFEALGLTCYPFIERYRKELDNSASPTIFCLLTREISPNLMAQGRKLGITHFLNSYCTDEEFIDAMREIL